MQAEKIATVRSVERALQILLLFTQAEAISLSEVSRQANLHKSTAFRLLATLEQLGFVKQIKGKFSLGIRIWELSMHLGKSCDSSLLFLTLMESLRDEVDETISLYILDGFDRLRVQAIESKQTIRRVAEIGARLPLYVGASSKALVAFAEREYIDSFLSESGWPDHIDKAGYINQLREIRQTGFAISIEEREPGTAAISVPILTGSQRRLVAALAISGPISRLSHVQMHGYVHRLQEAANEMGRMVKLT